MLSQCGEALPYSREKRTIARNYPARTGNDRNPNAFTYEDSHQQRTRQCEERARVAAWELHTIIYKSDADAKKTRICFPSHEERQLIEDSRAFMHVMSKIHLIHEEKETDRKSKESCPIIAANGTITSREEATVCVKDLDMLISVQFWEHSPAVLSSGSFCEDYVCSHERKENSCPP